jgi:hypothetical protein
MSAIEPAGEKIVRNLQDAVEALRRDMNRVELWAGALSSFTKPIPDYGHGQTRFDLSAPAGTDEAQPKQRSARRELRDRDNHAGDKGGGTLRRAAGSTIDTSMLRMATGSPQRD